jgi:hypothetical protein
MQSSIYRYKFTQCFTIELYSFAKIHEYDNRKDFKESWNIWVHENEDIISNEVRYLTNLSYNGDILDKMFKSARYYFRKKSTVKKEASSRCVYVGMKQDLLNAMDKHIMESVDKPSVSYNNFCRDNEYIFEDSILYLHDNGITESKYIENKFKKVYKNRYFIYKNK